MTALRFGGNANNGNCASRNLNANNAVSNANRNNGGFAKVHKGQGSYELGFVPPTEVLCRRHEHTRPAAHGELTGRTLAREFHGNYAGLYSYLEAVERQYKKKEILPIEEAVIVNQCGYIFEGSTNQIEYINI